MNRQLCAIRETSSNPLRVGLADSQYYRSSASGAESRRRLCVGEPRRGGGQLAHHRLAHHVPRNALERFNEAKKGDAHSGFGWGAE